MLKLTRVLLLAVAGVVIGTTLLACGPDDPGTPSGAEPQEAVRDKSKKATHPLLGTLAEAPVDAAGEIEADLDATITGLVASMTSAAADASRHTQPSSRQPIRRGSPGARSAGSFTRPPSPVAGSSPAPGALREPTG